MEITDISVRTLFDSGRLRAVLSITFDDAFVVHNVKVIQGEKNLFVAMPSRKDKSGRYKDLCHPTNSEMREKMETTILDFYQRYKADENSVFKENGTEE